MAPLHYNGGRFNCILEEDIFEDEEEEEEEDEEDEIDLEDIIRKWYLTILHDLCLPIFPIAIADFIKSQYGGRAAGKYNSKNGLITLALRDEATERDYVLTLAHEARHAWNDYNDIPQTEEDCDNYAESFCRRFSRPHFGATFDGEIYSASVFAKIERQNKAATREAACQNNIVTTETPVQKENFIQETLCILAFITIFSVIGYATYVVAMLIVSAYTWVANWSIYLDGLFK